MNTLKKLSLFTFVVAATALVADAAQAVHLRVVPAGNRLHNVTQSTHAARPVKRSIRRFRNKVDNLDYCAQGNFASVNNGFVVPAACRFELRQVRQAFRQVTQALNNAHRPYPRIRQVYQRVRNILQRTTLCSGGGGGGHHRPTFVCTATPMMKPWRASYQGYGPSVGAAHQNAINKCRRNHRNCVIKRNSCHRI